MSTRSRLLVVGASVALHGLVAIGVSGIDKPKVRTPSTPIRIVEVKKPPPPPPPPIAEPPAPPEPPPPVEAKPQPRPKPKPKAEQAARPPEQPRPQAAPPPDAAPPAPATSAPDFGLRLSGAVAGGNGVAVPEGDPRGDPTKPRRTEKRVVETAQAAPACTEEPTKAKPVHTPQPAFPEEARAAGVAGRVRLSITVDAEGRISDATLVAGLGHGLDESALEAVRTWRFEPATRCGRAEAATLTLSVRFTL